MNTKVATWVLAAATAAAASLGVSCASEAPKFDKAKTFATPPDADEPFTVSAKTLNDGHESYMLYCYACHGENGDGKGPSSYGLRPPPRDFTKGIFKFARIRSSDELPNDDDLERIVLGGLHGTAMLPWNIPLGELKKILQYVKTFAPEKWEKKKKNGDPVKTLAEFDTPDDPWKGHEKDAEAYGRDLYHFRAECINCHPAYGTKQELYDLSVAAAKREPDKFKAIGGFRDDPYGSVAKDSSEYNQRILPPDFTYTPVRSIIPDDVREHLKAPVGSNSEVKATFEKLRDGTRVGDLFRIISFGVYPIMPAWQGAGLSDKDIWAIAHYVDHLVDIKEHNSPELAEMKKRVAAQGAFEIPKPKEEKPAEAEKPEGAGGGEAAAKEGDKPAEGEAKKGEEKKPEEKKGEEKKPEEKKGEEKKP